MVLYAILLNKSINGYLYANFGQKSGIFYLPIMFLNSSEFANF